MMNTKFYWILFLILMVGCRSVLVEDVTFKATSKYTFQETAERLRKVLKEENIQVFSEIDHAAAAKKSELNLRPTLLFVVGNPKVGTLLMQEDQLVAIALPLKILIYEDDKGAVRLSYKLAAPLGRHYALNSSKTVLNKIDHKMKEVIPMLSGKDTDK